MRSGYQQLNSHDRVTIMLMNRQGCSVRSIARTLQRAPSTISRELHRSVITALPYESGRASHHAHMLRYKRRRTRKMTVGSPLFERVCQALKQGWSPQQIAGRLALVQPPDDPSSVSHETIYLGLYALPRGELRREMLSYLRQQHLHRWPRSRGTLRKERIPEELRIAARPDEIAERLIPGHWEGDFIKGASNRSAVGTLVERSSRLVVLAKMEGLDSHVAQRGFEKAFGVLPAAMKRSLTYDRGSEMAQHAGFSHTTGVKVYFADPYSPWQRGSNENMNGLVRQYLPKGSDLSTHSQADLDAIAYVLNNRPRKILGFKTPWEVFNEFLQPDQLSSVALDA